MHIFGTTTTLNPNNAAENLKSVLIEGDLEVRNEAFFGGASNYSKADANGHITFAGVAGFYPRFLTQSAEPAAGTGATQCNTSEALIWKDSDDSKVYLCFNDGGTVKTVELT
jgi:hypothetical protein